MNTPMRGKQKPGNSSHALQPTSTGRDGRIAAGRIPKSNPQPRQEMTTDKINKAIAEACGWVEVHSTIVESTGNETHHRQLERAEKAEARVDHYAELINKADDKVIKLEAEVAKLNHQLLKTESDLLQSQDINSFLDTEFRIACKRAEKAEAEVEKLDHLLADASETTHKLESEVERLTSILKSLQKSPSVET